MKLHLQLVLRGGVALCLMLAPVVVLEALARTLCEWTPGTGVLLAAGAVAVLGAAWLVGAVLEIRR